VLETGSFFRPISSEKRGLDGKRVHGVLIDELHEHATSCT
jgi:phage terminase large subunit-like protein